MIDFKEMQGCQGDGIKLVESLKKDEEAILIHYCSLVSEALMKMGVAKKEPLDRVVINALKVGVSLGLRLRIANGEVHIRIPPGPEANIKGEDNVQG